MVRGLLSMVLALLATFCAFAIYHSYQIADGTTLRLIAIPLLVLLMLAPKWLQKISAKLAEKKKNKE